MSGPSVAAEPTTLDIVTLVVAILGFGLAAASFVWQIVQFRFTGSVVKVNTATAIVVPPGQDLRVITVEAANIGRTPVAITGVGLLPEGTDLQLFFVQHKLVSGPELPHTLGPGQQASWLIEEEQVKRTLAKDGWGPRVRGFAKLATGKRVHDRRGIDLAASRES